MTDTTFVGRKRTKNINGLIQRAHLQLDFLQAISTVKLSTMDAARFWAKTAALRKTSDQLKHSGST